MASFSVLGFNDGEELESLLSLESEYKGKINDALLAQLFFLLGEPVDIADRYAFQTEVLSKFDNSAEQLKEVLADAILAYTLLGASHAAGLIGELIPGFSYEEQKGELQTWANKRALESFGLVQKTSRKRLEVALAAFVAGTYTIEYLINQYKSVAADLERASLINETESITAFNMGILIVARALSFVVAVKWNTSRDEKVCQICRPRHGMVYPINSAPSAPAHHHCRCFYALVVDRRRILRDYLGF